MAGLGFNPVLLGFALASLGYAIGLALRYSPMLEGRNWGGQLMSYSLLTAMFLAVVGSGQALSSLASSISGMAAGQIGAGAVSVDQIPGLYFRVSVNAMGILATIAGAAGSRVQHSAGLKLYLIFSSLMAGLLAASGRFLELGIVGASIAIVLVVWGWRGRWA